MICKTQKQNGFRSKNLVPTTETLCIHYKDHLVNGVQENNCCSM